MGLTGTTNEQKIWNYLIGKGLNQFGAAGLMGNLKAESGCSPINLQNSYEKKLGFTDKTYTSAVDNGSYTNFVKDSAGYGLAQWTYWSRKQNLLNFAKKKGTSIGDLEMQLDFLYQELSSGYKAVLNTLKSATSVAEASNVVLMQFERPANQSTSVQQTRASYGTTFYNQFATKTSEATSNQDNGGTKMSNSSLVNKTNLSPNNSGARTHSIDRITPHCFVGQVSVDAGLNAFTSTSRQASCNYVIATDGKVGLCVDEANRSWCSSSNANDQRAVTIECASDTTAPYAFNNTVYNKLIDLCADICKRNGKNTLLWIENKDTALAYSPKSNEMLLTVHRWFANKACPGDWMYSRMGDLASKVTAKLGGTTTAQPAASSTTTTTGFNNGDVIKLKSGATYYNGSSIPNWVFKSTLYYRGTNNNGIVFSTQKTGAVTGTVKASMIESTTASASSTTTTSTTFKAQVTCDALNYRQGPGTNYKINGTIKDKGIYTITQQSGNWGKLKSGAGWICLDYTKKV